MEFPLDKIALLYSATHKNNKNSTTYSFLVVLVKVKIF